VDLLSYKLPTNYLVGNEMFVIAFEIEKTKKIGHFEKKFITGY
jgi:hypothetical protein